MTRTKTRTRGSCPSRRFQTRKFDGETYAYGGYVVGVAAAKRHAQDLRAGGFKVRLTIPLGIGGKRARNIREVWKRYNPRRS